MSESKFPTDGPLAGVKVLDLTNVISGPAAMGTLADQGAEVIKVEALGGDVTRRSRSQSPGFAPSFLACNRGKQAIALDLKQPAAQDILWRLIDDADVFAQNFRPGAIERLGFAAAQVLERNPRLVYLSISGVGPSGPYAGKRVYDPVIQALSGLADIQADPVSGRPKMVRTLIADKTTAIYAAQAVTAALFARERSGQGQHVEISMLDAVVSHLWPEGMSNYTVVEDGLVDKPATAHDMIFPTADGHVTLGAVSDAEWRGLCATLNKPEWLDDPRFATPAARQANRQERLLAVEAEIAGQTTAQLITALEAADVPCAPVRRRSEVLSDPQVLHNELVVEVAQPGMGTARQARPAARFQGTPSRQPSPAPALGRDTDHILSQIGYDAATLAQLRADKVIA